MNYPQMIKLLTSLLQVSVMITRFQETRSLTLKRKFLILSLFSAKS